MRRIILLALLFSLALPLSADEGLWLFNAPPKAKLKAHYNFDVTPAWLDHVRASSVRFNNGGSGSFVSADGLAFTNNHVALDCLSKVSSPAHDYIKLGYSAKSQAEELKCPDLELNQLAGIEDVTAKVLGAGAPNMSTAEAGNAQRSVMSAIEADCAKATGLRCDIVTMYSGGAYHLYKYRKFTDIRLVFTPEYDAAAFGGDPDNFEFPRYGLDAAFFRVYENDKPLHVDDHFKWSLTGVKDGDLVFLSGNPGSTSRLNTMGQLAFLRDVSYPYAIKTREESIKTLKAFAAQSAENDRIAQSRIHGLENGYKSLRGYNAALNDDKLMAEKREQEKQLHAKFIAADTSIDSAWTSIDKAMQVQKDIFLPYTLLERADGFEGDLARIARNLVRATAEKQKSNGERMREFRESALPSLEQGMFSPAPLYDSLETVLLTSSLTRLRDHLGAENATVKRALHGKTPAEAAKLYVSGSKLKDVAFRQALYKGGWDAVKASDDPLVALMRDIDSDARTIRKRYDDEVDAVVRREGGRIAQARFKSGGDDLYPDATFTLRLSFGVLKSYTEDGRGSIVPKGTEIAPLTTLGGAFEREKKMAAKPPYKLPDSWHAMKSKMKLTTPEDFVSTADSIGGSSGSPVINRAGEIVGINFDRNMQGLGRNFYYSEIGMRQIAVDVRGILEAVRTVYKADGLANELTTGKLADEKTAATK